MGVLSELDITDILKNNKSYIQRNDWEGLFNSLGTSTRPAIAEYILNRTKIPLMDRLKNIPPCLFQGLDMERIVIPGHIKSIGASAFKDSKLKEVIIETGVQTLGKECFANCEQLNKIDLADTITNIPSLCFSGDTELKKVFLPDGVRTIGSGAFNECNDVEIVANFRDKDKIRAKKSDYEFLKKHLKFTHNN